MRDANRRNADKKLSRRNSTPRVIDSRAIPRIPVEKVPESGAPGAKDDSGILDWPSRLSLLEMQLRRLLNMPSG